MKNLYRVRFYNFDMSHHFTTLNEAEEFAKRSGFEYVIEEI
jgi:hypothetical protein